ncbi:MAG: PDZ domain-containing protein [Akkermansia sp.]
MKTCIFLTLGLLVGSGSGYSIDRPAGSTDNLQPPPLTPYAHQVKPLPSSKPARLGIVPGTVPQALVAQLELSGFPGVLVTKVMPDSPAAKAGLQENDVMVKLGDVSLSGPQSVTEALSEKVPGDKITAVFYRKASRKRRISRWTAERFLRKKYAAARETPHPRAVPSVRRGGSSRGMAARPAFHDTFWTSRQMMDDF